MTDARTLANDPSWLPDALDARRGLIRFARLGADALRREAFLDARKDPSVVAWAEARLADLAPHLPAPAPAAYVFHGAFCGSTLLARALDLPGRSLSLKEPNILLDLANARRAHQGYKSDPAFRQLADTVLRLVERRHAAGERIVIKPTNLALPLAPLIIARGSPVLFMHGGLREFLLSLLKKGEEGRAFARKMFNIFAMDDTALGAIEPRQAMAMTDLQVAALVWRHQLEEFAGMLAASPATASLTYAAFIASAAPMLRAASGALRLDLPPEALAAAADGPLFRIDAKTADKPFTAQTRAVANADLEARHGDELTLMTGWAEKLKLGRDLTLPLPRALGARHEGSSDRSASFETPLRGSSG
jgi:hypothetical protein